VTPPSEQPASEISASPVSPVIVFAAGGALETAFLPYRLFHLQQDLGVRARVALSPRARDFVSVLALEALTGSSVYGAGAELDHEHVPLHVAWCEPTVLVLAPATPRILVECAQGSITCPVTRLFAFTDKARVVVAPALHPRLDARIYRPHVATLRELGCAVVGGDDLFASFADVKAELARRLGVRATSTAAPLDVVQVGRPRGA
jgi:hypothetical protein